jgi:CRP-like cAMP-binding protein
MESFLTWLKSWFTRPREYMNLKEYSIFADLGSYDLFMLNELIHTREFKPGETIFEAGYPLEVIYLIKSGEIELKGCYGSKLNKLLTKGGHLGLLDMYFNGQRNSTATAKTKVCAHAISRSDLQEFVKSRPHAGVEILSAINRDVCRMIFELAADEEHELD